MPRKPTGKIRRRRCQCAALRTDLAAFRKDFEDFVSYVRCYPLGSASSTGATVGTLADDVDRTSYTVSGTSTANRLHVLYVLNYVTSGTAGTPTVSGLTRLSTGPFNGLAANLALFSAYKTSVVTDYTIDFGAATQAGCLAHWMQVSDIDPNGGSDGSTSAIITTSGRQSSGSTTSAAFGFGSVLDLLTTAVLGVGVAVNEDITPDTGTTQQHDAGLSTPDYRLFVGTAPNSGGASVTPGATWTTATAAGWQALLAWSTQTGPGSVDVPTVHMDTSAAQVAENAGPLSIGVHLSHAFPTHDILIDYATSDGSATAGTDYTSTSGTLTIPADSTTGSFNIPIANRAGFQANRSLTVTLSNARLDEGLACTISDASTTVLITDVNTPTGTTLAQYGYVGTGWTTHGVAFTEGEVPSANGVQIGAFTTQTDVKTRWPDNSLKYAIVTANITAAGTYALTAGATSGTAFTPTWPTGNVALTISGTTWTATLGSFSAADLWLSGDLVREARSVVTPMNGATPHPSLQVIFDIRSYNDSTHRVDVCIQNVKDTADAARYVCSSVVVTLNGSAVYTASTAAGTGTVAISGAEHKIATFSSGSHGLIEGSNFRITSGALSGEVSRIASIVTTGTVLDAHKPFSANASGLNWETPALVIYNTTRPFRKTFNVGSPSFVTLVQPDLANTFEAVGVLTPYRSTMTSDDIVSVATTHARYAPGMFGDCEKKMGIGGDQPERYDLGPHPEWTSRFLAHKTQAQYDRMMANVPASGCWSGHLAQADGVSMINPDSYPNGFYLRQEGVPAGGSEPVNYTQITYIQENAHRPNLLQVPYLLTGDRWILDQMRFWAHHALFQVGEQLNSTLYQRRGRKHLFIADQVRGMAWGLLACINAYWCLPDSGYVTEKAYFLQKIQNNLDWLNAHATNQDTVTIEGTANIKAWETGSSYGSTLEWVFPFNSSFTNADGNERHSCPLSNLLYLLWMLKYADRVGLTPTANMANRICRINLKRFTSEPGYDADYQPKEIAMGPVPTPTQKQNLTPAVTWYTDMATVAENTYYTAGSPEPLGSSTNSWTLAGFMGPYMLLGVYFAELAGISGATAVADDLEAKTALMTHINTKRTRWAADIR